MGSAWVVHKYSGIPLHEGLDYALELPWTISYVIRKRAQIDSYTELPKEKRPPDRLIWDGTPEEIDDWFDKVFERKGKKKEDDVFTFDIDESEIG